MKNISIKVLKIIWHLFLRILKILFLLPTAIMVFSKTMDIDRFNDDVKEILK